MGNTNKTTDREAVNFHTAVVSQLVYPKPAHLCKLKLAFHLADIVREYTGDSIVNGAKAYEWPENMGTNNNTTVNTRRTRILDRVVKYAEEFEYSNADVYNAFFALCPHIESIVRINKGQNWESAQDWFIYDIYAQIALLCVPNKTEEFLMEKAAVLVRQIDSLYEEEDSQKVREFCKFLETQFRQTMYKCQHESFGYWMTECVQHFCEIACNDEASDFETKTLVDVAHLILHFCFMHPKIWFHKPSTLVAVAVNSASTFLGQGSWGNWYRVQFRTAVREGILLDTETQALINPGQLVHVVQQFGRRVQIDQPCRGFCSLHDGAGLKILTPVKNDEQLLVKLTDLTHEQMQSPFRDMTRWIFTERTSTYTFLKQKFSQEKHSMVSQMKFQSGQLILTGDNDVEMTE